MNQIIKQIEQIKKTLEDSLPIIDNHINTIIQTQSQDIKTIEQTLDTLLDYIPLGLAQDQFTKLNNYYHTFNEHNSNIYNSYLLEALED